MHTTSQAKAAGAAHTLVAKPAAQPLMSATVDAVEAPSLTEQQERARLGHSFGAIRVFPPDPPIQPKRVVESASRLPAFRLPSQGGTTPAPVIPAGWAIRPPIQAKLTVGEPNDQYEQEADRVAEQVMRMTETRVQAKCACGGEAGPDGECAACKAQRLGIQRQAQDETEETEEVVQTKSDTAPEEAAPDLESRLNGSRGSGQALPEDTRSSMESAFGADFGGVRVHTGNDALQMNRELSAHAFTHGSDIYFNAGKYEPGSAEGKGLLAHELTHVVQQGTSISNQQIQRNGGKDKKEIVYLTYQVLVPASYTTLEQMYRLFERTVYGKEMNFSWRCNDYCDMSKNSGKVIHFKLPKSDIESHTDPVAKEQREQHKKEYGQLTGKNKQEISDEVNKRYYGASGDKPGTKIKKGEKGKAQQWDQHLDEVIKEKENLERLPPEIKQLMGGEGTFKPKDYQQLLHIAGKLKRFGPEDFAVYKLLAIKATDKLDLFEKSVDMYLARKEELKKALEEEQKKTSDANTKEPTMQDAINEVWKGLDESAIGKMTEEERYKLAQQKANEVTIAQLKYMKDHPGATLKDFAKSATLMNTGETFSAIGKDITEVASGDANTWARWAAGTGAGAKLSGWLLAVAGVLYVASWLTGIGELATIAAAAGYLLGATLVLSSVEHDLRVKAASQAKNPEEFKRNVELGGAALTTVVTIVAAVVVAAVLHFTAKALFPETMKKLSTSLKNLRERVRIKGSVFELKPEIVKEMGVRKAELAKVTELAKQKALGSATELEGLSTEQFVEKLEKGDGGFMDQSKLPPEQKVNYRELLKTPEGRAAIEGYKQKLVNALKTDVLAEIDKLSQEYGSKIDEFLKDVDAAKNHDDLNAALDKIEGTLTDEHAKKFMADEQEKLVKQKIEAAGEELKAEIRKEELSKDPQTGEKNQKAIEEAEAILQAEKEGFVKNAKRPDLKKGDPNLDFKIDGPSPYKWADPKTPVNRGNLVQQAEGIGRKTFLQKGGASDVLHVIDLKNIPPAEKADFIANVIKGAGSSNGIVFINK